MVVVIDDRSDVWGDIANLVKVVPYDFFLGIGDINSSFLPPNPNKPLAEAPRPAKSSPSSSSKSSPAPEAGSDAVEEEVEDVGAKQQKALDDLSKDRPLAKLQEKLDAEAEAEAATEIKGSGAEMPSQADGETAEGTNGQEKDKLVVGPVPSSPLKPRKPLLNPNDDELDRVSKVGQR